MTRRTQLATKDGRFYMVNFLTVDRENQIALAENMAEGGEKAIRHRSGNLSVNVLKSTDGYRVLYLAQWGSKDDIRASMQDPEVQKYRDRASALGKADPHAFTVFSTHYPAAAGQTITDLAADDGRFYMVNFLTVERENQMALAENMAEAGEKAIRHRPGCLSVNVLRSTDGYRVMYMAQWQSKDDIRASMLDPEVQKYRDRASVLGKADPHAFIVFSTHYPDVA